MKTTQKVEQVKAYFSAVEYPHSPLHEAVKDTKGCRLGQTEDSILQVCQLTELKQTKMWERHTNRFCYLYDRDTTARKLGKALSRMANRQNRVRDQAFHYFKKTENRKTS